MPKKQPKPKTLPELIVADGGPEAFAAQHGISERAAKAYLHGERRPRPQSDLVAKLLRRIPWEGIYGS